MDPIGTLAVSTLTLVAIVILAVAIYIYTKAYGSSLCSKQQDTKIYHQYEEVNETSKASSCIRSNVPLLPGNRIKNMNQFNDTRYKPVPFIAHSALMENGISKNVYVTPYSITESSHEMPTPTVTPKASSGIGSNIPLSPGNRINNMSQFIDARYKPDQFIAHSALIENRLSTNLHVESPYEIPTPSLGRHNIKYSQENTRNVSSPGLNASLEPALEFASPPYGDVTDNTYETIEEYEAKFPHTANPQNIKINLHVYTNHPSGQ